MRHTTFFDESVFLVSFSVALGILALVIPAHGAAQTDFDASPDHEYIDLCDTGSNQPDCVAAVRFGDTDKASEDRPVTH